MPVALVVLEADVDRAALLTAVQNSDYVREMASGEDAVALEDVVRAVPEKLDSVPAAAAYVQSHPTTYAQRVFCVADAQTVRDASVLVVEVPTKDTLRVAPGSLLELVMRANAGETTLRQFRAIGGEVYDAGQ